MSVERQPYYKHYPADWRGDANLRRCSLAARGLWQECLGFMHEADDRGTLDISVDDLALMVSRPIREVRHALAELERHGVSSRDERGRLVSRRMMRDTARSLTLAENGRRGGNPVILVNQGLNQDHERLDKPLVKSAGVQRARVLNGHLSTEGSTQAVPSRTSAETELIAARFNTFWDAFPNKIKRKQALAVFSALNPDAALLTRMLDALAAWRLSRQWREGYVPHATTWLRGEQWNDQVPPEPVVSGPMTRGERAVEVTKNAAAELIASLRGDACENGTGVGDDHRVGHGPGRAVRRELTEGALDVVFGRG